MTYYLKYLFLFLCFTGLIGCIDLESPQEQLEQAYSKIEHDGIYMLGSDYSVFEFNVAEEKIVRICDVMDIPLCKQRAYGFERAMFSKTLTKDEFLNSKFFVKITTSDRVEVHLGRATPLINTYDKYIGEEIWKDNYCHSENAVIFRCKHATSGLQNELVQFKSKKISADLYQVVPIKKIPTGKYFFWLETEKNGFTKGYPFTII